MNLFIIWLGTIIISFNLEIANELRVFKDIADAGYKVNLERLSEVNKMFNTGATQSIYLSILTPILNIIQVFQRTIQYNNIRYKLLDELNAVSTLEEMTETEKQAYLKKPTAVNAVLIHLKKEAERKITLEENITRINNQSSNQEESLDTQSNDNDLEVSNTKEEPSKNDQVSSQNRKKQALEELKSKLLEEQQKRKKSQTKDKKTLTKKR